MTDDRSLEAAARSWLEVGPAQAPDRAVEAALRAIDSTPQERGLRIPWRFPPMTRHMLPAAAALVIVLSGALLLPRLVTPPSGNQSPSPSAVGNTAAPTLQPTAAPGTAEPTRATTTLVAFQVRIGSGGLTHSSIWVESPDGSISRDLFPDKAGASLIGRTHDGNRLLVALAGESPTLALVDIDGGDLTLVPSACPSDPCWADFQSLYGSVGQASLADDDRTAVAVLRDESNGHQVIATIDLATGRTDVVEGSRGIFFGGPPGISFPRLSPDGTKVAYVVGTEDLLVGTDNLLAQCWGIGGMLVVVDRVGDSSTQRHLVPFKACAADPRWSPAGDELLYTTSEVTNVPTGTTPGGGTAYFAIEHHDIYRVTLDGAIERFTTNRTSSYGAWTRDGRISYAPCDPDCDEVWILDPATGERSKIGGALTALGKAGCAECPYTWKNRLVIGFWPGSGDVR